MAGVAFVVAIQHLALHRHAYRLWHVGERRGPRMPAPGAPRGQDRVEVEIPELYSDRLEAFIGITRWDQ